MLPLPAAYAWLAKEQAPKLLVNALKLYGVTEVPGPKSSTAILGWAQSLGGWIADWYKGDDIPWCGLYIAECCRLAGLPVVAEPLRAKAWAGWGVPVEVPMLGDMLIFDRDGGGHVGICVGEDAKAFHVLGGNQGNAVSITRIERKRLVAARRTDWAVGQPKNVRRVIITNPSALSKNEA